MTVTEIQPSQELRAAVDQRVRAGTSVAPLGAVDVDAFENNARAMVARAGGLPIRVASKSLRSVEALRNALSFDLVAEEVGGDIDEILDNWETHARSADHFECFWFPHTDRAQIKRNTRLAPDAAHEVGPRPKWKEFLDEELVGNGAFAAALALGRAVPASIPYANRIATAALSHNRYRGTNHGVFVSPRRVRFHEMEYAVPLADGPAVVREIRSLIDRRGWRIGFPLELRTTAADDVALSTSTGRESMYIATHVPQFVEPQPIFAEIEPLLRAAGGRPHWGKMHTLGRADLAELYPRFDEFCALREQMDPQWRFGSNYLKKLFG